MLQPKHNKGLEAISGENHSVLTWQSSLKKSSLPQATEPPKSQLVPRIQTLVFLQEMNTHSSF